MNDDHPEYNASAIALRMIHPELMILGVRPDGEPLRYEPGQYATLGLLTDERRVGEIVHPDDPRHQLIRRVYSISGPVLNDQGELVSRNGAGLLEFYIALVRRDSDHPPSLTPRLFAMEAGHRLFLGPKAKGTYTLQPVNPDDDVIFLATGTGEAPHNTMIRELLARHHQGRIASFVCVRRKRDLGYMDVHRQLEKKYPNYRYVTLTTREPENTDRENPGYIGRQYLQHVFSSNRLQQLLGWVPDPATSHVFLCGNPAMIGAPKRDADGDHSFPDPKGMIETLIEHGYRLDRPRDPGNIHYERYW